LTEQRRAYQPRPGGLWRRFTKLPDHFNSLVVSIEVKVEANVVGSRMW
jgi:hypothetical protein